MEDSGQRDSRTRFAQTSVLADAACAAQLRQEFAVWLKRYFALDPTKVSDVVLAVNEALANAAEFAYSAVERPGAMHLLADYDTRRGSSDGHGDRRRRLAHRGRREEEHLPGPRNPADAGAGRQHLHRLIPRGHAGADGVEPRRRDGERHDGRVGSLIR